MSDTSGRNFGNQGGESSVLGPSYASNMGQTFASGLLSADAPREFGRVLKEDVAGGFEAIRRSIEKLGASSGILKSLTDQVTKLANQVKAQYQVRTSSANVLKNGGEGNTPPPYTPMTNRSNGGGPTSTTPPSLAQPMTGLPNGGTSALPKWGDIRGARPPGTPPPELPPPGGRIPPPLNGPTGGGGGAAGGGPTFGQIRWGSIASGVGLTAAFGISRASAGAMSQIEGPDLIANQLAMGMPGPYSNGMVRSMMRNAPRQFQGFNSGTDLWQGLGAVSQGLGATYGSARFQSATANLQGMSLLAPGLGYGASAQALLDLSSPQMVQRWRTVGLGSSGPILPGGGYNSFGNLVRSAFRTSLGPDGQPLTKNQINEGMQPGSRLSGNISYLFGPVGSTQYQMAFRLAQADAQWRSAHNGQSLDFSDPRQMKAAGLQDTMASAAQTRAKGTAEIQGDAAGSLAKTAQVFDEAVGKFAAAVAGNPLTGGAVGAGGAVMGGAKAVGGSLGPLATVASLWQQRKLAKTIRDLKNGGSTAGDAAPAAGEAAPAAGAGSVIDATATEVVPGAAGAAAAGETAAGLGAGVTGGLVAGSVAAAAVGSYGEFKVAQQLWNRKTRKKGVIKLGKGMIGPVPGMGFVVQGAEALLHRQIPVLGRLFGDGTGYRDKRAGGPSSGPAATGNTINQLKGLVDSLGIPYTVTSSFRTEPGSYHSVYEAIDIAAGAGPDSPEMMALDHALASKYGKGLSELIHAGPGAVNIKNGKVVDGNQFYGASTMAGHHNHVHVAASPDQLKSLGGIAGSSTTTGATGSTGTTGAVSTPVASTSAGFLSEGTASESGVVSGLLSSVAASGAGQPSNGNGGNQNNVTGNGGAANSNAIQPTGSVADWIKQGMALAGVTDPTGAIAAGLARQIKGESGGNPKAINNWDSNAKKGVPSKGLMQMIDPSFMAYAIKGHTDWSNPVDDIAASLKYDVGHWGSIQKALDRYGPGKPNNYEIGTWDVTQDQLANLHKGEMVVPAGTANMVRSANNQVKLGKRSGGGVYIENLHLHAAKADPAEARRLVDMMYAEIERRERLDNVGAH